MGSFEDRVKNARLTKIERKISEYILANYDFIGFMTSAEIAEKLHVSTSSVVRLSRTLGYVGFNEMMALIREEIVERMNAADVKGNSPVNKLAASWNKISEDALLSRYFENLQVTTSSVIEKNSSEKFHEAQKIISSSEHRYVAGFYGCRPAADLLTIHLSRIFPQTTSIIHADSDAYVRLINIKPKDCLILFSYARYANIAIRASQIARSAGARLIVITDKITAPVATGADVVLLSEHCSGSFFNSSVALVMTAEILALSAVPDHSEAVERQLTELDKYLTESNLF